MRNPSLSLLSAIGFHPPLIEAKNASTDPTISVFFKGFQTILTFAVSAAFGNRFKHEILKTPYKYF